MFGCGCAFGVCALLLAGFVDRGLRIHRSPQCRRCVSEFRCGCVSLLLCLCAGDLCGLQRRLGLCGSLPLIARVGVCSFALLLSGLQRGESLSGARTQSEKFRFRSFALSTQLLAQCTQLLTRALGLGGRLQRGALSGTRCELALAQFSARAGGVGLGGRHTLSEPNTLGASSGS